MRNQPTKRSVQAEGTAYAKALWQGARGMVAEQEAPQKLSTMNTKDRTDRFKEVASILRLLLQMK